MTRWFLSYLWRRPDEIQWQPMSVTTTGEHPLDYIQRAREAYSANEYVLMFFQQVPEDVFLRVHPGVDEAVSGAVPTQFAR